MSKESEFYSKMEENKLEDGNEDRFDIISMI